MNDVPQIDDRRRFKELWKEMLYARMIGGALVSLIVFSAVRFGWPYWPPWLPFYMMMPLLGALPSSAAKRGKLVLPSVAAAGFATCAMLYLLAARGLLLSTSVSGWVVLFGCLGAAIGVTEGLLERSMATIYSGLIGGMAFGALAGKWTVFVVSLAPYTIGRESYNALTPAQSYVALIPVFVILHVGIGRSLALGRLVRDWPKRKADEED